MVTSVVNFYGTSIETRITLTDVIDRVQYGIFSYNGLSWRVCTHVGFDCWQVVGQESRFAL